MDRKLKLALVLSAVVQTPLVVTARYRLSYDAYVHMFFADHYRHGWWTLWESRWYTGFYVVSYPPLVHQVIALLSIPLGVEAAFAVVLLAVLIALPAAEYAFARIFVGRAVAGYTAVLGSVLPAVFLAAHVFGQLPTLAGLLGTLWGLAVLNAYLCRGHPLDGCLAVTLFVVTAASHHGTLLLVPWAVAAVALNAVLSKRVGYRVLLVRLLEFGVMAVAGALLVIWPFWKWGSGQAMQTPIDHLSRHNFLVDRAAPRLFFWPVYGPLVLVIPWAAWVARRRRRLALALVSGTLLVLGLGGTTPLPRWLYGAQWAWLTYDRFALWAAVTLLPFAGLAGIALRRRMPAAWLWVSRLVLLSMGVVALLAALIPVLFPTQPAPVDMVPIVTFLAQEDRAGWRYLTFGFGDQMARLSLLTTATTMDGSYHTARQLAELRSSGIGQIDTAYWSAAGLDALDPILQRSGARGVRWGFVNLEAYEPVLARNGWVYLSTLSNGIRVWENPAARLPAEDLAPPSSVRTAAWWGTMPLAALGVAVVLAMLRMRGQRGSLSGGGRSFESEQKEP